MAKKRRSEKELRQIQFERDHDYTRPQHTPEQLAAFDEIDEYYERIMFGENEQTTEDENQYDLLITVRGRECSGKTTVRRLIASMLEQMGASVGSGDNAKPGECLDDRDKFCLKVTANGKLFKELRVFVVTQTAAKTARPIFWDHEEIFPPLVKRK